MTRTRIYILATFGALLIGAGFRVYHLTADSPNYFAGLGQALMTDPYHITIYARNKVLFGSWEIFDYNRWVAFKVSLVSGFAWLMFSLGGVSRLTANLTSVLLNLSATGLLVAGVFVGHFRRDLKDADREALWLGAAVSAFLLSFSHVLVVYGRAPFLENGLLLIAAACFFVVARSGAEPKRWKLGSLALVGVLLAMTPLAGKLFGLILLAPVAVTVFLSSDKRWKDLGVIAASGIVTVALWYVFVLGDDVTAYHAYLQEQSMGLYGTPPGLLSLKFFFIQLFSYGGELRLFQFSFFMPLILLIGYAGLLTLRIEKESPWTLEFWRRRPALTFLTVWFFSAWLSLMIFQYRPLRYALFVLFPGLGVVGCIVREVFADGARWAKGASAVELWQKGLAAILLYVGITIIMTQTALATYGSAMTSGNMITVVKFSSIFAAPALIVIWLIARSMKRFAQPVFRIGMLVTVAFSLALNGYWYYRMASNFTYDTVTASRDMESSLPADAVLTGPYAPNLTMDNSHKNLIYTFGLKVDDRDLFERFPITHLVGDYGNLDEAARKFPRTKDNVEVSIWMFRDAGVRILRLGESFAHMQGLPETALEKSDRFLRSTSPGAQDSAVYYGEIFLTNNPGNRAAKRQLFQALLAQESYTRALEVGKQLVDENPSDCLANYSLARSYFYLAKYLKREDFNREGEKYLNRACELNPAGSEHLIKNSRRF